MGIKIQLDLTWLFAENKDEMGVETINGVTASFIRLTGGLEAVN